MRSPRTVDGRTSVPDPPEGPVAEADIAMRFEDVAQDGRLLVTALLPGLGATAWRALMAERSTTELLGQGVIPILTRIVAEAEGGPFGIAAPMSVRGVHGFSHALDAAGEVDRLHLGMWVDATVPVGATYGPPPAHAGQAMAAGRLYAEHTLTRPFAAPDARRVRRIDVEGIDPVPGPRVSVASAADSGRAPNDARLLDGAPAFDAAPIVFGLAHTDSNKHVNSLVYIRIFEDAALRALARHDRRGDLLLRRVSVGYRKPCFAGESVRISLQAFEHQGRFGAFGAVVPAATNDPGDTSRAHAFMAVSF